MERRILLWIIVAVLLVFNIYFFFKTGNVDLSSVQGQAVAAKSSASSGMVGGC